MEYPAFIKALPALDMPYPANVVSTHAIRSEAGLVVSFAVHRDLEIPEHQHGSQWGAMCAGEMELTWTARSAPAVRATAGTFSAERPMPRGSGPDAC